MKCTNCETPYDEGALVCLECGAVLLLDEDELNTVEAALLEDVVRQDSVTDPQLPAHTFEKIVFTVEEIMGSQSAVTFSVRRQDLLKSPARIGRRDEDKRVKIYPEIDLHDLLPDRPPLSRLQASVHLEDGQLFLRAISNNVSSWVRRCGERDHYRVVPQRPMTLHNDDLITFGIPTKHRRIRIRVRIS